MQDLKARALRGGFAKLWSQAAIFLLRLGSLAVLARLLKPEDFGLVGMVVAVTGIFNLFRDAGLTTAAVQSASITKEQLSTLFWMNMGVGGLLALLSVAIAPLLVAFYREPRLFWLTVVSAAGNIFFSVGVQHSVLLQRQMRFSTLAIIDTFSMLVGVSLAIGMAVAGFGYWALVGMSVISPAISSLCFWLSAAWVPGAPRLRIGIRSILNLGGIVTLNNIVTYIGYNFDKVLLGRFKGADVLGIYGRAYQVVKIPNDSLNAAIGDVSLAALSRLQDDRERLKRYFLNGYSANLALTFIATFACALFAEEIVLIILGPEWKTAEILVRLLTPTVLVFGLINPFGPFLYAIGLGSRSLKMACVIAPLTITSYVLGLPHGPNGVAFAFSAAMTLSCVPLMAWCIHRTVLCPRDLLGVAGRPLISAAAAAALTLLVKSVFGHLVPAFPRLFLGAGVLLATYLWMLLFVMGQKAFYFDILKGLGFFRSFRGSART